MTPLAEVIRAARRGDDLVVRQWIADCVRERVDWSAFRRPPNIVGDDLAIAAGLVEIMAANALQASPTWTGEVPAASEEIFLSPLARQMRRTREVCRTQGPEPLRKRQIMAPPGYLTIA